MPGYLYVADPMCSWCWGFAPVLERVVRETGASVRYVMGGLAPDSDEVMPEETRAYVQSAWDAVERATGARFERAFWERCIPRRSTWPACRAVLAAERLEAGSTARMFAALQRAYYLEARNPSEVETLIEVGTEQGFEREAFGAALESVEVRADLERDFALKERLGVSGFPTLVRVEDGGEARVLTRGYAPFEAISAGLR